MTFRVRPLDPTSDAEINTSVSFGMLAVLETVPSARRDPSVVPYFTFAEMRANYAASCGLPDRCFLFAEAPDGLVVGQSAMKTLRDEDGRLYGYFSTRYVLPRFRRQGLGQRLLDEGLGWMRAQGAEYAVAHTHATNEPLLGLFRRNGFEATPHAGRWEGWRLCREPV